MDLARGQSLTHYEILGPLGAGAMGEVYRARDTRLERDVALKVLPRELAGDEERLRRFEREAKTLASLNHPNVAQVYGIDQVDDTCFMAMELVRGQDLAERLKQSALSLDEAIELCAQIAEGVEAAHESGVIHRDLKPANVLLTPDGKVKVLDFGLAKAVTPGSGPESHLTTEEGRLLGTPKYMSPEQVRGKPVDRRTDVWSFGCVLFECLTGRHPFNGATLSDLIVAILEHEPELDTLPPDTPTNVRRLLARCFDKDPRTRLRDMGEARIALRSPDDSLDLLRPRRLPIARLSIVLAFGFLLTLAAAAILGRRSSAPPRNPLKGAVPRVLALEGSQYDVAVTPSGDAVVFGSDQGGQLDLWRWSLEGGAPVNLTRGRVRMFDELVRNVGFRGSMPWVQDALTLDLLAVPGPEQALDALPFESGVELVYSRDGRRALYHTHDSGDPIYIHGETELRGEPILRGDPGVHLHYPAWSTDEEWIYYAGGVPSLGAMHLWRMRVDGSDREQLSFEQLEVSFPTPLDDETVLFLAKQADGSGPYIFSLDLPSRTVERSSVGVEHYTSLAASNDGRLLAATLAAPTSALWRMPLRGPDEEPARESDVERLGDIPIFSRSPSLRGDRVFYLLSFGGGYGLYVHEDGQQRKLWEDLSEPLLFPPAVSPSGDRVALVRPGTNAMKLSVLDVSSRQLSADLQTDIDVRGTCAWSPDERSIAVAGIGPDGTTGLYRIDVVDGSWAQLVSVAAVDPAWASSRDLIVFGTNTVGGPRVEMRAVDQGGRQVDVDLRSMAPRFRLSAPVRFTADGQGMVYTAFQDDPFMQQFFYLDLATGESHQISSLDLQGTIRGFDLTPNGSHIVFDRTRQNSDVVVWSLEERDD